MQRYTLLAWHRVPTTSPCAHALRAPALRTRAPRSGPAHTRSALRPCAHAYRYTRCVVLGSRSARLTHVLGSRSACTLGSACARLGSLGSRNASDWERVCVRWRTADGAHTDGRLNASRRRACGACASVPSAGACRQLQPIVRSRSYAGEVECAERNAEVGTPSRGELPTGPSNVTLHGSASGSEPREARRGDVIVAASAPLT